LIFVARALPLLFKFDLRKDREGNLPWRGSSSLPERMLDRTWPLR
jgi:hypothetical protein